MSAAAKKARIDPQTIVSTERLRDLFVENETIQRLRNSNDLLERLIMARDGTDLRAVVAKIAAYVQHSAKEYNALHDRMRAAMDQRNESAISQFMHQKLASEDERVIDHLFNIVLENNPNDDKARIVQLAIVFMALTIEIDARQQFTAQTKHVDRFGADGAATDTALAPTPRDILEKREREEKERANQIQIEPLVMFLKNDARRLLTQLTESMLDLRAYVTECVSFYMSYKRPVCAHTAARYYNVATE